MPNETDENMIPNEASMPKKLPSDEQVSGFLQMLQILWQLIKAFKGKGQSASPEHAAAMGEIEAGLAKLGVDTSK